MSRIDYVLGGGMFVLFVISLSFGPTSVTHLLTTDIGWFILTDIRVPRAFLAMGSGCVLALAGGCLQVYFNNPLADAGVLGISSMSAFGAVISIYCGAPMLVPVLSIVLGGVAGAFLLCCVRQGYGTRSILLMGISLSSFSGALICLFLNLTKNPYALLESIYWLFGSFENRTLSDVWLVAPFWVIGSTILFHNAGHLNNSALGDDLAMSRGTSMNRLACYLILGITLCVGPMVAVTGVVGFIGLIAPHIARFFSGSLPTKNLRTITFIGGALSLSADIIVRILPGDINVGVVTALIGTPIFVYLLTREM